MPFTPLRPRAGGGARETPFPSVLQEAVGEKEGKPTEVIATRGSSQDQDQEVVPRL